MTKTSSRTPRVGRPARRLSRIVTSGVIAIGTATGTLVATAASATAATGGGLWPLDETSGTIAHDTSGNNNDGTIRGPVGLGAPGHDGTAFDFHQAGSWVEVPNADSLNPDTADFTVSAWVNVDTTPGSKQVYDVVRKGLAGTNGGEFDLQIINHGYVRCVGKDAAGASVSVTGPQNNVADGHWHYLACTRSGSSWQVTVDGDTRSTTSGLGSISNTKSLAIGSSYGNNHNVLGLVDQVQLSFAATQPPPPPPSGSGLGAHWKFTEVGNPPAKLIDYSGNGNDGNPVGGVVGDGTQYTFKGSGRVEVPDSPTLNPGSADFSYSVTFTTTLPAVGTDYDLMRKGYATTTGGEYKVEVLNVNGVAKGFCLVKDSNKHVARVRGAGTTLADGKQHTITCSKTSTGVTIMVDDRTPRSASASGGLGSVSNSAPLTIGAKADSGGDWFIGTMSDASIG